MPRVALVVTGELERLGLAESLRRTFPGTDFHVEVKLDGFTSARLPHRGSTPVPGLIDKLAGALVAAVDPGRNGTPSDLAIAVDDLEIVNLDQPDKVVEAFRDAVVRHVNSFWPSESRRDRARERLRTSASIHLLSPMIEAYFFGDAATLAAAGAAGAALLDPAADLEDFTVTDANYLDAPTGTASWARANRARHPKAYLQFLIDPRHPPEVSYRETRQGVAALSTVDWGALARVHGARLRLLRSLLVDIADALGQASPHPTGPVHPATSRKPGVLRNA